MKLKIVDTLGFLLFLLLFILFLPVMMIIGAINTPIRYFKYVSCKVHNKKPKSYWW